MATVISPQILDEVQRPELPKRVPWYLWCATLAVTSVAIGAYWDVSWHRSIGRDTFWTPAHMAIYLCGVLAGISFGYLILSTTFVRGRAAREGAVRVLGFNAPLGAFIAAWGGIAMITSAPFDNWWHNAYGLDVKIISPPHTLLVLGAFAVHVGLLFVIASTMNRAGWESNTYRRLQALLLYAAGLLLIQAMFFRVEYTTDVFLHNATAYISISLGVPIYFGLVGRGARNRWACTWMTAIYSLFLIGVILILQIFPAQPKLGPVYEPITHFVPPEFPLLLIVPAVLLDLLWRRIGEKNALLVAAISGPVFLLSLVAAQWPFTSFLMTKAAHNPFFVAGYPDYSAKPWSPYVLRQFVNPQHGLALWSGLGIAVVYSTISIWLGLMLGDWMRKIQR
ncbi:MAG TPA: hypothetical protein VK720_05535 [Terracidiphilus sp.]|jgi:hypothetical protein|nr:hypothetical protein [Terracidiphilus sp.]